MLLLLFCLLLVEGQDIPPTTEIQQGRLNGLRWTTRGGRTIAAFLGVPFATPPIGPLRFKVSSIKQDWIEGLFLQITCHPDSQYASG